MRMEKSDDMIKKYLVAETSLNEEQDLFESPELEKELAPWSTYVKLKRKKSPPKLKDSIMAAIQSKQRKKQRFLFLLTSAAASIALLIAFFINTSKNRNNAYLEKEALLLEAMSMFSVEEKITAKKNIIYEDDMLIIYLASN